MVHLGILGMFAASSSVFFDEYTDNQTSYGITGFGYSFIISGAVAGLAFIVVVFGCVLRSKANLFNPTELNINNQPQSFGNPAFSNVFTRTGGN